MVQRQVKPKQMTETNKWNKHNKYWPWTTLLGGEKRRLTGLAKRAERGTGEGEVREARPILSLLDSFLCSLLSSHSLRKRLRNQQARGKPECYLQKAWLRIWRKGGFPPSRNFYVRTLVNKIETMHGRSRVNVKVEPRSTFNLRMAFHALPLFHLRS